MAGTDMLQNNSLVVRCGDITNLAWGSAPVPASDRLTCCDRAVAAERGRIAVELHDSAVQSFTAAGLRLAELIEHGPGNDQEALSEVLALIREGRSALRDAVDGLYAAAAGDELAASIDRLCEEFRRRTGILTTFSVFGRPTPLGDAEENALFRVAREALANVAKHAKAAHASVELRFSDDGASLSVQDDGVGLGRGDPPRAPGQHGIRSLRRSIRRAGGELSVGSNWPHGVLVNAVIPGRGTAHDSSTGGDGG